jgi:hypothetical protein
MVSSFRGTKNLSRRTKKWRFYRVSSASRDGLGALFQPIYLLSGSNCDIHEGAKGAKSGMPVTPLVPFAPLLDNSYSWLGASNISPII